jgi:hypothetical protein
MTTTNEHLADQLVDGFLRAIAPTVEIAHGDQCRRDRARQLRERPKGSPVPERVACACPPRVRRPAPDADFLAMFLRHIRAFERRVCYNPELLADLIAAAQRLDEVADIAVAVTTQLNRRDRTTGLNGLEVGAVLGCTKQAASKRRERGIDRIYKRLGAGAERTRDREIIQRTRRHTVVKLADFRARRAG